MSAQVQGRQQAGAGDSSSSAGGAAPHLGPHACSMPAQPQQQQALVQLQQAPRLHLAHPCRVLQTLQVQVGPLLLQEEQPQEDHPSEHLRVWCPLAQPCQPTLPCQQTSLQPSLPCLWTQQPHRPWAPTATVLGSPGPSEVHVQLQ